MKNVSDILSEEQIKSYREGWKEFDGKYRLNSSKNTHSGMPVIGNVFRYQNKLIFRSHVFQKKLRNFNPYFISEKYLMPIWHIQHYFMVVEQMYHASSHLIRDHSKLSMRDIPEDFSIRKPIIWGDKRIFVELILEDLGKSNEYFKERSNFTIYEDDKNRKISNISFLVYYKPRAYVKSIEEIKQGDNSVIDDLIKKIEMQDINLGKLNNPRKTLETTKDYLISELREGRILEEELHDFFSLWD